MLLRRCGCYGRFGLSLWCGLRVGFRHRGTSPLWPFCRRYRLGERCCSFGIGFRRCVLLSFGRGLIGRWRHRRSDARCRFRGTFFRLRLWFERCDRRRHILRLLLSAFVKFLRHALLDARNAIRKNRFAIARQLLLGVEKIEHVGRIETAIGAAARQGARQRSEHGCGNQSLADTHRD